MARENIPRILQTDIYDALTSERSYKKALTPQAALAVMEQEAGGRDQELVSLFASVI
jgi:HD-GYP domain-containing protein (c-di-GMP phosphodiesterase class II)